MLVLVEQQLDVLHEQQLEQEHELEHQPAASIPKSAISSTSNVTDSSAISSSLRFILVTSSQGVGSASQVGLARRWSTGEVRGCTCAAFRTGQLVLEQLLDVQEQQLDVEQLEQLEQLELELHQPAAS